MLSQQEIETALRDLAIFEDDLLPCPNFEQDKRTGKFPEFFDLTARPGKLWFGHAYRMAHGVWHDRDSPSRLHFMATAFLALSTQMTKEFVIECLCLAIDEIKNGKPGVPHPSLESKEMLAKWREKTENYFLEQDAERLKQ